MPERWPVTIRDDGGEFVEVDVAPSTGRVYLCTSAAGVWLNADQYEAFSQASVAASHEAGGRVPT